MLNSPCTMDRKSILFIFPIYSETILLSKTWTFLKCSQENSFKNGFALIRLQLNFFFLFFLFLQPANATVMPDNVVSTWSYLSFLDAFRAEFVSDVDMQRREDIVIIVERVSIEIQRSKYRIGKHANVSEIYK